MTIYHELDQLGLDELIGHFHLSPPDGPDYSYVYYSDVAFLIVEKGGQAGINYLRSEMSKVDSDQLRAILQPLAAHLLTDLSFKSLLITLLANGDPMLVMETIDCLCTQSERSVLDKVLVLWKHPSPYVRGAVLRYIRRLFPQMALPILIEGTLDAHYIVRENAADELGELGDDIALPQLEMLLKDSHPHVQQAAQTAIQWIQDREQKAERIKKALNLRAFYLQLPLTTYS